MLNFLNKKLFFILIFLISLAKAMQEHKSTEEGHEVSVASKIVAFNKYKKINDTFPDTIKFLSKVLSKKGIEDLSLQQAIITYLKEYLFQLRGYCSIQRLFRFKTGHQVVLMTKNGVINHINDLRSIDAKIIGFQPEGNRMYSIVKSLDFLTEKILSSMNDREEWDLDDGWNETVFKRVVKYTDDVYEQPKIAGKWIPFKISPTNRFTLDIVKPCHIVLEEDFNSTFESSKLYEWTKDHQSSIVAKLVMVFLAILGFYWFNDLIAGELSIHAMHPIFPHV